MSVHEYRDAIDPRCKIGRCSVNNCLYPDCLPNETDPHPKGAYLDGDKLAADIRKGDIAVVKLDTASSLNVNDWLTHTLTLEVELLHHDAKPAS
jgi:hypothetical protein